MTGTGWGAVKRAQAHDFDLCANVASGIGEYGAANACWRVAAVLRQQARDGILGPARGDDGTETVVDDSPAAEVRRLRRILWDIYLEATGLDAGQEPPLPGAAYPDIPELALSAVKAASR